MKYSNFDQAEKIANKVEKMKGFADILSSKLYPQFDLEAGRIILTPIQEDAEDLPPAFATKTDAYVEDVRAEALKRITKWKTYFEALVELFIIFSIFV